jgi:hypothetical protein
MHPDAPPGGKAGNTASATSGHPHLTGAEAEALVGLQQHISFAVFRHQRNDPQAPRLRDNRDLLLSVEAMIKDGTLHSNKMTPSAYREVVLNCDHLVCLLFRGKPMVVASITRAATFFGHFVTREEAVLAEMKGGESAGGLFNQLNARLSALRNLAEARKLDPSTSLRTCGCPGDIFHAQCCT